MRFRIISLNICHGGGKRIAQLAHWLLTKNPNVIVLPEWRNDDAGRRMLEILRGGGFKTIVTAQEKSKRNSVLLAAIDFTETQENTPPNSAAGDLILLDTAEPVRILGCYFPQGRAKLPFFQKCTQIVSQNHGRPLIFIGDFNTGRNDLDIEGTGTPFHCADLFTALSSEAGLTDLWRARHADRQDWTWRSHVNGFRIDHAFGNEAFINRFPAFKCEIDHEPRLLGLSDHSAVVVDSE